ncbi:hypothetical protein JHD49_07575 [Sulfurimonas sp. SAG-AH-194-C21]|nr:hypothetical protein [Sulfurimonas sp. SAG-AH-194-C21]MDF1883790.1 hypothetical protein [Sulfurimonas sp. SAG-AH-194-C21]
MGISSVTSGSTATSNSAVGVEVQKKAQDIQAQQVLKVLESTAQQTQQAASQKTGIGSNLNLSA